MLPNIYNINFLITSMVYKPGNVIDAITVSLLSWGACGHHTSLQAYQHYCVFFF